MKRSILLIITYLLIVTVLPVSAENIGTLSSDVDAVTLVSDSVTLKSGEYAHYSTADLESGAYDVYLSGNEKTGISIAVGSDRYLQLVAYEIKPEETCLGRLTIYDGTENIRIENTGTTSFTYTALFLKKIAAEAEISVSETSTVPQNTVTVSGSVTDYCGVSEIKLKTEIFEEDVKTSEVYYDINAPIGEKTEYNKEITASGDKMVFAVWDSKNEVRLSEEKVLCVGTQKDIYVSAAADDDGDGTKEKPFNTLTSAQLAVRDLNDNMTGDIVVHLSGKFNLSEKMIFDERDSGTNGFKIVWDGAGNAVLSGEKELGELAPEKGMPYVKLKTNASSPRQLYVNDNHAVRAKSDKIEILSLYNDESYTGKNHDYDGVVVERDVFKNGVENFEGMQAVFVHLWNRTFINVSDITENEDGNYIIKFQQPEFDAMFSPSQIEQVFFSFHLENSPLFLDEQNEWCYDGENKEILYIPKRFMNKYGNKAKTALTEGLVAVSAICGETVENISFKGIKFTYGGWSEPQNNGFAVLQAEERYMAREATDEYDYGKYHIEMIPAQVSVKNAENITFDSCSFSNLASVALALREKTHNSTVRNCEFTGISAAAINVGDTDIAADAGVEEFCRNITVTDNYITKVGEDFPSSPAITVYYANNVTVSHNEIKDVPYSGISVGWGWGRNKLNCRDIKILNNKIVEVMKIHNDGGHIYTLGAMPGTVISGNYMEKSGDYRGGIYLDNTSQYILIENNVAEVVDTWLVAGTAATYNKRYNTARNNYSRVKYVISDPEINNFAEAKDMSAAENYAAAQEIMGKAGKITK